MSGQPTKPPALLPANGGKAAATTSDAAASTAPGPAARDATSDPDPMIISGVTFTRPVTIGGYAHESWSVQGSQQNQYHGKSRVEECLEGVRFFYKAGDIYEERTVYAAAIADVCRIPLSRLNEAQRTTWHRLQAEIRR